MKLIVIEGLDGAGKSTQIKQLGNWLSELDINAHYLHFPRTDAPWFGDLISRFLRGEFGSLEAVNPYLVAMIYAGDRKDASETIRRWLSEGSYVLLDRYTYSNIAYQCAKIDDYEERIKLKDWILGLEFGHFAIPKPDLNIFLDVPFMFTRNKLTSERTGTDRDYLNGSRDIHEENLSFQEKVRKVYLETASGDSCLEVVDCSEEGNLMLPPEKIFEKIVALLRKRNIIT
jgi:dTMP kinase